MYWELCYVITIPRFGYTYRYRESLLTGLRIATGWCWLVTTLATVRWVIHCIRTSGVHINSPIICKFMQQVTIHIDNTTINPRTEVTVATAFVSRLQHSAWRRITYIQYEVWNKKVYKWCQKLLSTIIQIPFVRSGTCSQWRSHSNGETWSYLRPWW